MRNSTGLRFFLAATSLTTLAALFVACSDDDGNSDITGAPDAATDTNRPDTNTVTDTGPPDTGPKDAAPDGPGYFAGDATVLDGGPDYEGGVACVIGGQVEQEVNDEPGTANELRTTPDAGCVGTGCSVCGVITDSDLDAGKDAGDGGLGGTELEYVSFVLHSATKNFYIQYGGDVTLVVTVEGSTTEYVINSTSSPTLPYSAGKRYSVLVKSNTGAVTPWRVTLFENQ